MEGTSFYSYLSRMKNINRWGLMRNTRRENLQEHSMETAVLAHALALLHNRRFGGNVDCNRIAVQALFHDAAEIITGDMPTPVKYASTELREAYRKVEREAEGTLISLLPADLKEDYLPLFRPDAEQERFVKAADKLSALIKCMEEKNMGNHEFDVAYTTLLSTLREMHFPPVDVFLEEFLPSYALTLDEQNRAGRP